MAAITAGFASKSVVFGAATFRGQLHEKDVELRDEYGTTVLKRMTVLHVPVARCASAVFGSVVVVDGVSFTTHDNRVMAGGALRELVLAK